MPEPAGIPFEAARDALARGRPGPDPGPPDDPHELLRSHHPDHQPGNLAPLPVGPNQGEQCHRALADVLCRDALVDETDLVGLPVRETGVLVIGGGGAGCAAALEAADAGAHVLLVTKLALGDSNTVMAESGIQAAVNPVDSLQAHFDDSHRAGHRRSVPALLAQMVADGPDVIRWLLGMGMQFDRTGDGPSADLATRRVGGATAARLLSHGDATGLELMKILREAVRLHPRIEVLSRNPVVELLGDSRGGCGGAVVYDVGHRRLHLVRAPATLLCTGGLGRLHLGGFPTSNHFGATGDGLVLAYRLGARLRDVGSLQYHPTGLAAPSHLRGMLVPEAIRSAGATLHNGRGERFVDELQPRDVVAAAILRECAQGRGIRTPESGADADGTGVFLDLPGLLRRRPGVLDTFPAVRHLAHRCHIDPGVDPLLVHPTLHYHNGGVAIDVDGTTHVPGLLCAGESAGGIHGHNRLAGNALLDILAFGRRAGRTAAARREHPIGRPSLDHVREWRRQLAEGGIAPGPRAPLLFPSFVPFDLRDALAGRDSDMPRMSNGEAP